MGRGPKPAKSREAKSPVSRKSPKNDGARVRDLEKQLVESLEREKATGRALTESLEQQTATSEILRVIASSPTDVRPVFEAILKRAATLCGAQLGHLWLYEGGEQFRLGASYGSRPDHLQWLQQGLHRFGQPFFRESGPWRVGQVLDVRDTEPYRRGEPVWIRTADHEGMRTLLGVPLVKDGRFVGSIAVYRRDVQPFTDQQTALVQTFADQAVIAIENVRLFTELQEKNQALTVAHAQVSESLDQQTATSEILGVISQSPTDVQPVFDTIVESARRLLRGYSAALTRVDGDQLVLGAFTGTDEAGDAAVRTSYPRPIDEAGVQTQVIRDRGPVNIAETHTDLRLPESSRVIARARGYRSMLAVPLLRQGEAIGGITVTRREPGGFTDDEIALLKTFADQAVIAIENVRLFTELQTSNCELTTALDRQTATSDILRAISRAQTDVQPAFEAIVDSALRLFRARTASMFRLEGEFLHPLAARGGLPGSTEAVVYRRPQMVTRDFVIGRCIVDRSVVHVPDVLTDADAPSLTRELAGSRGFRAALGVPLMRDAQPIGSIAISRAEPGRFSDGEIALLQTFADQAVIAIENVRLFKELEARNRDLTATSEILRVISTSPTDVQPVFDAIVTSAARLCDASFSTLGTFDGELIHIVAAHNFTSAAWDAARRTWPARPNRAHSMGRAILERAVVHIPDVELDREYDIPEMRRTVGFRSILSVPMMRDDKPVGAIAVGRAEAGPFSDNQIALLQTFADQAVIAIENVRLFKELEARNRDLTEALEQQTATSDVLRVISQSQTDIQPVFDALIESATRLCVADIGAISRLEGDILRLVLHSGMSAEVRSFWDENPPPLARSSVTGRAALERRTMHVPDILADSSYDYASAASPLRKGQAVTGYRAALVTPMLRDGAVIGTIAMLRREAGPFTESQIKLLETFADQAVIAIENVRLFKELQTSNRDLTTALDQQTATSEILRAITHAPTDTQPVFDTIVRSGAALCHAVIAGLFLTDDQMVYLPANYGSSPEALTAVRALFPRPLSMDTTGGMAILTRSVVHVPDTEEPSAVELTRQAGRLLGFRSLVTVPMLREGEAVGAIGVYRREAGWFSDAEVALLKTFADQAVIAIENVRLFTELQEKNQALTQAHAQVSEALEQQTATAEILRVISQSQTELQPVFEAIIDHAMQLFKAWAASVLLVDGQLVRLIAMRGGLPGSEQQLREQSPWPMHTPSPVTFCIANRTVVHIPDIEADHTIDQGIRALGRTRGWRSILAAPIVRDGQPIGAISIQRAEAGAFSSVEIELLKTFTDQAGIAVENTRLLGELRARTSQLTRSVEELTALSEISRALSSTLDLDVVLRTIVTRASQLAGADACSVFEYDEATEAFHLRATHNLDEEVVTLARQTPTGKGEGVQGRMAVTRQPVQVPDISEEDAYRGPLRDVLLRTGTRAVLAIPMLRENELIGGLTVNKGTPGEFSPEVIELLKTFATQSALAIQNARLFREIEDKSRQLEVASQHKSEFLANMSHELRTPLNAIIGFSEVLSEKMFGELNEKQEEYLKDIYASGNHLLSLINDILDLSKIEAGRMELELSDFHLPTALDSALTLVRERAGRRNIALHLSVDERLGQIQGDERKVRQVVLNLLSNAIKFTPEGGRIEVGAVPRDGSVEVSVSDTGVGIAPEDQEAVFEEFRQVGTADKKVEGTGLGLTLCRKFVELHGGQIWLKSQVGAGSTFTFTIPVRSGE